MNRESGNENTRCPRSPQASGESTDSSMSTDNRSDNRSTVREPETWLGATSNQAIFFMTLMKLVLSIYDFKQLMTTATVTMKDGTKAVFSPEHALEHAKGENRGAPRGSPTFADARTSRRDCSPTARRAPRPHRPRRMVDTRHRPYRPYQVRVHQQSSRRCSSRSSAS